MGFGVGCFVFRGWMFFFVCFKTSWSQINMSILYSEYESLTYFSLHLGKMHVFGPCTYLSNRHEKAWFLHLFPGYIVCNFANENKELPMLFRGLEIFHWLNVIVFKLMISAVDSEFTSTCMGKESETLIFMFDVCHADVMTKWGMASTLWTTRICMERK